MCKERSCSPHPFGASVLVLLCMSWFESGMAQQAHVLSTWPAVYGAILKVMESAGDGDCLAEAGHQKRSGL